MFNPRFGSPGIRDNSCDSCQAVWPSRSPFTLFAHVKNFPVLFFFAAFCTCTNGFAQICVSRLDAKNTRFVETITEGYGSL